MDNLSFNLGTIINLGGTLLIISGFYWKIKIDIATLEIKIAEIEQNRIDDWLKHDEDQDKSDSMHAEILKGIGEIKGDIKQVKTDISWLKGEK